MTEKKRRLSFATFLLIAILTFYSIFFFMRLNNPSWMVNGDTINTFLQFSYHYSGITRGEYPLWNPLVRVGEPEMYQQASHLASPVANIPAVISAIIGVQDTLLVYSIYLFIMVVLYVVGVNLLIKYWTENPYAGLFASLIALGSSTVFFYVYHVSFVLIVHMIPWMLYSLTRYIQEYRFRYLLLFMLSFCVALYSYQFTMGLAYLIFLLVSVLLFYFRSIPAKFREMKKKAPLWHFPVLACLLIVMTLPAVFMLIEFSDKVLPISRVSSIRINDNFMLEYSTIFERLSGIFLFQPKIWISMFTGITFEQDFNALRQFAGPVALPFAVLALFSSNRLVLCFASAGVLIGLLSCNLPPANLFFHLPIFKLIRNAHFLWQFVVFTVVVIAGFGFDTLMKKDSLFLRKVFIRTLSIALLSIILLCLFGRLSLLPPFKLVSRTDIVPLSFAFIAFVVMLLIITKWPKRTIHIPFIVLTFVVTMTTLLYLGKTTLLGGSIIGDPDILALRGRIDHSLQFSFDRPDSIKTINARYRPEMQTDAGIDEFSSYATLRDNSYKTKGGNFGMSSFPALKSYYLFSSLPGNEIMLRKKFFFFEKCYISTVAKDMMAFKDNPNLLKAMVESGTCIADKVETTSIITAAGRFDLLNTLDAPASGINDSFQVKVRRYNANSIDLNVKTNNAGMLTYTDLWDEGWRVLMDGKPVALKKVFHTFKGVEIAPGEHEIKFFYVSKTLVSIIVMNLTFIFCLIGLIGYTLLKRTQEEEGIH